MLWGGSNLCVWRGGTEKGGMGREIALTLPSQFFCLPLTQAKELDMSCDTIGTKFS